MRGGRWHARRRGPGAVGMFWSRVLVGTTCGTCEGWSTLRDRLLMSEGRGDAGLVQGFKVLEGAAWLLLPRTQEQGLVTHVDRLVRHDHKRGISPLQALLLLLIRRQFPPLRIEMRFPILLLWWCRRVLPGWRGDDFLLVQGAGRRHILVDGPLLGPISLRPLVVVGWTVDIDSCILPLSHVHRLDVLSLAGRDLRGIFEVELVIAKSCLAMVRYWRPHERRLVNCTFDPLA